MPAQPSTPCTRARPGNESDHLIQHGTKLYTHDIDIEEDEPWLEPMITLGECSVGDRVFVNFGNWPRGERVLWKLFEVIECPGKNPIDKTAQ